MPNPQARIVPGEPFFIDEEGSDLTFYLDATANHFEIHEDGHATINGLPIESSLARGMRVANATGGTVWKKRYSFSGRIVVKDMVLNPGNLAAVSKRFWKSLKNPPAGSAARYLCDRLALDAGNINRLRRLGPKDREALLPLIVKVLTGMRPAHLDRQKWAKEIKNTLSRREKALIQSVPSKHKVGFLKRILLEKAFPELQWGIEGRGLICLSHAGRYLSVTFRKLSGKSGYAAESYAKNEQRKRSENLFSLEEYCSELYKLVFQDTDSVRHAQGLLVISGSTNSAKSEIARGLIDRYLKPKQGKRRSHLVTFEDPIERLFAADERPGPQFIALPAKTSGTVDYTPRQKEKDVGRLRDALADALRQTPAVVYVGETRERKEWELLLDFAATGHLIVTTAHAGSLAEALNRIFEACKVNSPAQRSEVANKLLGIIHIKSERIEVEGAGLPKTQPTVLFPTLWRRTPSGIAALTADGLASLLPQRPPIADPKQNESARRLSCIGRRWFLDRLMANAETHLKGVFGAHESELRKHASRKAAEWDLRGI